MKHSLLFVLLIPVLLIGSSFQTMHHSSTTKASLKFLEQYNKKYPFDVNLLKNKVIKQRLITLVGASQYTFMTKVLDVCGPMKVTDGIFEAQGCQSHNCGPDGSGTIIVADINNNVINVGIRNNGKVKTYTENGKLLPPLTKWAGGK